MSSARHDLPEDIWVEIVKHITVGQDARNFSLTCRVARDATLPVLFRTLSFDAARHPVSYRQSYLNQTARRAESLLANPQLLFHVLEVYLRLSKSARGTLYHSTCDKICATISASPRVQKLFLYSCIITPGLHKIIYDKPSLRSLEIYHAQSSPLLDPQPVVGLTRLSYRHTLKVSPSWFMQLLDCSLPTLISLTVDDTEVIRHFLSISRRRPLALQTLAFSTYVHGLGTDLCRSLVMCPELRTLRISASLKCVFPDEALTKLEFLEGELDVVSALIPGRSIHTVHLTDFRDALSHADATLLQAGRVPVRHLTLTKPFNKRFPFRGVELQHLANGFRNLLSLSVHVMPNSRDFDIFAAPVDTITDFLSQWPQLQVYRLFSRENFIPRLSRKYSRFPIAPSGDPCKRGHPSLVEFRFTSTLAWLWFPDGGWTLREVDGTHYPRIPDEDPEYVSRHTFSPEPFHSRWPQVLAVITEFLDTPFTIPISLCLC